MSPSIRGWTRNNCPYPLPLSVSAVKFFHGSSVLQGRTGRRWSVAYVLFLIGALCVAIGSWAVRAVAEWLVVEDPLSRAPAIVVLNGGVPFRAMEAASLYQQGWAPEVWLMGGSSPAEEEALMKLGIQVERGEALSRQVLERSNVPSWAICLLNTGVKSTVDEVRLIAQELARRGGDRVIIVTSKTHTRRVRATWRALVGNSPVAIVRYATKDPYSPSLWWRDTHAALVVSREILGLMNVWTGFPVR